MTTGRTFCSGVAVPEEMDCRVLSEVFVASAPPAQPVEYSSASIYRDGALAPGLSEDEMADVQEKLEGWGYAGRIRPKPVP